MLSDLEKLERAIVLFAECKHDFLQLAFLDAVAHLRYRHFERHLDSSTADDAEYQRASQARLKLKEIGWEASNAARSQELKTAV